MTFRGSTRFADSRGTVILVALCFVAVLGIMLAGYLALCSRVMTLSNRGFQADLSRQLAEAGIDEALRAFNKNDWSDWSTSDISVDWDTSTYASDRRAMATISYASDKFAQGVTATVKLRVDNHDAHVLGSAWSSSRNYRIGDRVGYSGIWYSCVRNHSNQTPNGLVTLAYWVPEPFPWKWRPNSDYSTQDVVNYDHDGDGIGTWFSCNADHTSPSTWTGTNWTTIGAIALYGTSYWSHSNNDIFYYPNSTTWYRWTADSPSTTYTSSPAISWDYDPAKTYKFNDLVCYGSTYIWYRFINGTPTSGQLPTNTTYWENALSGGVHGWSSSTINYNIGDVVYYSATSQWYRCILAHTSTSITPSNTTYWVNTPALSQQWTAGPYYAANDVVSYNGVWYLCILSHTSSTSILPTNTSYWIGADTTNASYTWNATTAYSANSYRCYDGVWYKCIAATTANAGHTPNNATYWTAAWSQSSEVTTGAPVVYAEAVVTIGDGTTTRTQLRAPIAPAPLFPNAVGATTTLTITGGTGTVDSYDSSLGTTYASQVGSSTNYSAVLAAGTASAAGTSTLLSIGDGTTVQGYVAAPSSSTTPYAPRTSFGTSAVVKSAGSPVSPNVDLTQVSRSPYVPTFDSQPTPLSSAFSSWNFPYGRQLPIYAAGTVTIGTPGATAPSRYYFNGTLDIGTSVSYDMATLNIIGPVKLYINGHLNLQSGGLLRITSTGSAEIHTDGRILTQTTAAGFDNQTLDPKNLILISDWSSTTVQRLQDNTYDFYGVVYAPNTLATYGLEVRTGVTIYGALSAREITFNNEANLHYDTSLRYATFSGVDQPYTVTSWSELAATEQATMP